jgi:hypothetical protein
MIFDLTSSHRHYRSSNVAQTFASLTIYQKSATIWKISAMAPTKKDAKEEKEAKLTPEQSAALIMDYLRKQNRPYSATDISTNLKNRVTKAAATKLLKDMHERKEVEGRASGKQIVYHSIQVCPQHRNDNVLC